MGSQITRAQARAKRRDARRRNNGPLLDLVKEIHERPSKASLAELKPLTAAQKAYDDAIFSARIVFGVGSAGTGKTWWAASRAADQLRENKINRLVVTRPAIEAGENLGFMPGELEEKYEPYFRPVRDALEERLGRGQLEYMLKAGRIEARPLAFLRGATLKDCWVIFDEAQNATVAQMKMFLTRIGHDATFIVNGDPTQKDIPGVSGLADALDRFASAPAVRIIRFGHSDIVRDPLCQMIAERYEQ